MIRKNDNQNKNDNGSVNSALLKEYGTVDPFEVIEIMIENAMDEGKFDYDTVRMFFQAYPDFINDPDCDLLTASCYIGNIQILEFLLELGYDFGIIKDDILNVVCSNIEETASNLNFVQKLINLGADVNGCDRDEGYTVLFRVLQQNKMEFAKLLLRNGAVPKLSVFEDEEEEDLIDTKKALSGLMNKL